MHRGNDEVSEIAKILYKRKLAVFQERKKSFNDTQEKIRSIETQRNMAQSGFESHKEFKRLGGDYIWQSWLGTKTTQLQQEIAINAALMIEAHENVREDFAKLQAIKKTLINRKSTRVRMQNKEESEILQSLGLLKRLARKS